MTILVTYIYINQTDDVIISVNIDKNDEYNKNIVTSDINTKTPVTVDNILILNESLRITDLSYRNLLYMKYNQTKAEPLPGTVLFSVKMDGSQVVENDTNIKRSYSKIYSIIPGFMTDNELPIITGNLFNFNLNKKLPYRYRISIDNFGFTYSPPLDPHSGIRYVHSVGEVHSVNNIYPTHINDILINSTNIRIYISNVMMTSATLSELCSEYYYRIIYDPYNEIDSFYSVISISFVSI